MTKLEQGVLSQGTLPYRGANNSNEFPLNMNILWFIDGTEGGKPGTWTQKHLDMEIGIVSLPLKKISL